MFVADLIYIPSLAVAARLEGSRRDRHEPPPLSETLNLGRERKRPNPADILKGKDIGDFRLRWLIRPRTQLLVCRQLLLDSACARMNGVVYNI